MRKDLAPRDMSFHGSDNLIRSLSASVVELQRQVSALSGQFSRQSNESLPSQTAVPLPVVPPVPSATQVSQHPHPAPMPPPHVLEDAFLNVLSAQNTNALVAFVNDHWIWTEGIFPTPPGRTFLSQAVVLTLLHRVSDLRKGMIAGLTIACTDAGRAEPG